jgi:hypothetical protein
MVDPVSGRPTTKNPQLATKKQFHIGGVDDVVAFYEAVTPVEGDSPESVVFGNLSAYFCSGTYVAGILEASTGFLGNG